MAFNLAIKEVPVISLVKNNTPVKKVGHTPHAPPPPFLLKKLLN